MKLFDRLLKNVEKERRTIVVLFSVVTVIFVFYSVFNREIGFITWARNGFELRQQRKEIVKYETEIRKMDDKIQMLSNDRDTLERFARENFHFAAPGEDVYLIREDE